MASLINYLIYILSLNPFPILQSYLKSGYEFKRYSNCAFI